MSAPISNKTLESIALRAEWACWAKPDVKDGYQMGAGQVHANTDHPWDSANLCDCSAFADWCAGVDKHGPASAAWQNTDALVNDGLHALKQDLWRLLDAPVRGCLIVYGGHTDADGKRRAGHVGVVLSPTETADCSSTGMGIRRGVHTVQFFLNHGAVCVAPNGVA